MSSHNFTTGHLKGHFNDGQYKQFDWLYTTNNKSKSNNTLLPVWPHCLPFPSPCTHTYTHTHTHTCVHTHTQTHAHTHTHTHTHSIHKKESLQDKPASNNNISPKLWQSCRHAITKPSGPSCHKCHLALECVSRNHTSLFDWKVLCLLFCWPATSCCRQASWTGTMWPL